MGRATPRALCAPAAMRAMRMAAARAVALAPPTVSRVARRAPRLPTRRAPPASASAAAGAASAAGTTEQLAHGLELLRGETAAARAAAVDWGSVEPLQADSAFIKPQRLSFEQDGSDRKWDMVASMPSVAVLLYHHELDAVILVRQFRAPVHAANVAEAARAGAPAPPVEGALTYELVAGLLDKDASPERTAIEEVAEEAGYRVESLHRVVSYAEAIGISGPSQTLFFGEIFSEAQRIDGAGGGLAEDGEAIDVLTLPAKSALDFALDDNYAKSAGLMFGLAALPHLLERYGERR